MSKLLAGLNPSQREAVTHETGPLLIIAGPGSGKTRTVVHSIAYAIEILGVLPDKILAFSFTRKASGELKHRVQEIVDQDRAANVWISTFHSFCGKVLRQDAQRLEVDDKQEFTVNELTRLYNESPRAQIEYLQHHQFAEPEDALRFINECRAADVSPTEVESYAQRRHMSQAYVEIYQRYRQLAENDEANYTECQLLTNALFRDVPEVRKRWQEKFELIFVDEYQDTDPIQYQIIKTLAEKHQNLRVVGDDDQGIYGWRGADIQNILNFENDYPTAKPITLGQNYRSTQKIVETSRALVEFNPDRREKDLFTKNFKGKKVIHLHCKNDEQEAETIASFIFRAIKQGNQQSSDFAVLYCTHKQAEVFKTAFGNLGIPYRVVRNSSSEDASDVNAKGVSLMTIYTAKGLEFPNVFVAGVCSGLLPHFNSMKENWDEELRLLYVAMTRAENWLCLSSYEEDAKFPRGRSPFLSYIPLSLLKTIETLDNIPIPPQPEEVELLVTEEPTDYVEPLPEKLLGSGMTVIGVDPGNVGARETNVGWSVTQKTSDGYSVLDHNTEQPIGKKEDKLKQIARKINSLIVSFSPDAIAVEKLEVAIGEVEDTIEKAKTSWFYYVAGCVATIRSIADQHGIECRLYTPQDVKHAATDDKNADKKGVQKGVMQICNLPQIPEPHHSADAIAASLCYLRSYLNSSRFEGNKRKQERYEAGCDCLGKKQYEAAVSEFKKAINIDPIYTAGHCGLGRAYLAQSNLEEAENAAKKALGFTENNHLDSQKLLAAIAHYRSGCDSLSSSQWNKAIDKFKESIKLERIFTEAHCGLSRAYFEVNNLEAAKNAAEEALRLRYEYPPAQKLLVDIKMRYYDNGEIYFNREEYAQAIFKFQKAVEIDQNFKEAHRLIGEAYLKLEELAKGEKSAREALQIDSTYQPAVELLGKIKRKHKEHGDDYRNRRAYAEAVRSYQQAIRIDDKYKNAYNSLGIVYWSMTEYSNAISAYQQAIDIDRRCQVTHTNLSMVYRKIGEYDEAISSLKRAIAIKPDYQRAYYNLADTYFEMENLQDASETILKALRFDANDQDTLELKKNIQDAHLEQGRNYFRQGNLEAAESFAKAALKLGSNYQNSHKLLNDIKQTYYKQGLVCIEDGTYTEAISVFQKVIEIDPEFKEAHYSLGETYFTIGDLEAAEKEVGKVLRIDAQDKLAPCLLISIKEKYYKRGLTSLKQNEWKAAEKFAKEVLRIDPNYELASGLLKQAYYEQGLAHIKNSRYVKGINKLQKGKDIDPNCEKIHYHLGWAYFKLDRLKEAQLAVKNALSIQPDYPQACKLLSEINDVRNWLKLGKAEVQRLTRWIVNRIGSK